MAELKTQPNDPLYINALICLGGSQFIVAVPTAELDDHVDENDIESTLEQIANEYTSVERVVFPKLWEIYPVG